MGGKVNWVEEGEERSGEGGRGEGGGTCGRPALRQNVRRNRRKRNTEHAMPMRNASTTSPISISLRCDFASKGSESSPGEISPGEMSPCDSAAGAAGSAAGDAAPSSIAVASAVDFCAAPGIFSASKNSNGGFLSYTGTWFRRR